MTEHPILIQTIDAAAAALYRGRFCTGSGAVPAAGARCIGVVHEDVDLGDPVPVMTIGVALVQSGDAITLTNGMALIEVDNLGRAIPTSAGVVMGAALDAATAAGQWVRVKIA